MAAIRAGYAVAAAARGIDNALVTAFHDNVLAIARRAIAIAIGSAHAAEAARAREAARWQTDRGVAETRATYSALSAALGRITRHEGPDGEAVGWTVRGRGTRIFATEGAAIIAAAGADNKRERRVSPFALAAHHAARTGRSYRYVT